MADAVKTAKKLLFLSYKGGISMANFSDSVTRALCASVAAGTLGASIGGSVTSVFGPLAPSGAAVGGLVGSVLGASCSFLSDLLD